MTQSPGNGAPEHLAANGADAGALSPSRRSFLRYWSLNMTLLRRAGWRWVPGFSYGGDEQRRMDELAAGIPRGAILAWLGATVLIFLVVAIAAMTAILGTALTVLWPNPADMPEAGFFVIMALALMLAIGVGMPLSIAWGGAVADRIAPAPPAIDGTGDAARYAKVRGQFRRMGLALGVCFLAAAGWWALIGRAR